MSGNLRFIHSIEILHKNILIANKTPLVTLFRPIAVFCGTDIIVRNIPHIQPDGDIN